MAFLSNKGLSGQIGKQLVFKAKGGKTIVSAYTEPEKKKGTELQNLFRDCFRKAQKRASRDRRKFEIIEACTPYLKEGQSLYHFLMGLYHREEISMMKKGENKYQPIEMLLKGEPKRARVARKAQVSQKHKQTNSTWPYAVKNNLVSTGVYIPALNAFINQPYYAGFEGGTCLN